MTDTPPEAQEPSPQTMGASGRRWAATGAKQLAAMGTAAGSSVLNPRRLVTFIADGRLSTGPVGVLDVYILALPLAVAIVNPGTGFFSGFYAALLAGVYLGLKYAMRSRLAAVDWLIAIAFVVVVLSPLWAYDPLLTVSASRGNAVVLAYFLVVRRVIHERRALLTFARAVAAITTTYAAIFLLTAETYDSATTRAAVDFANANYSGAVLAFGGAVAAWMVTQRVTASRLARMVWSGVAVLHVVAVVYSGSRASLAGLLAAQLVVLLFRRGWRSVRAVTGVLVATGFVIGFFPQAESVFRWFAGLLSGIGPFTRSDAAAADLSGRTGLWSSTRDVIAESPLLGSGSEGYRMRGEVPILAHSWGLEFAASVGVVGAMILAAVIYMSFVSRGTGAPWDLGPQGSVWNAATALSLLPNLVLSTHQWTLWAWVGIALWSRAAVLDSPGRPSTSGEGDGLPRGAGSLWRGRVGGAVQRLRKKSRMRAP